MSEPQLLLLDEPAAGLNTAETNTLRDLLKEVSTRGITLLLVDHDMPSSINIYKTIKVIVFIIIFFCFL